MKFHRQFPQSSFDTQLDAFFANEIKEKLLVLPFRREYQVDFNLKSLPQTTNALYDYYRNYGTVWAIDQFVDQHPDAPIDKARIEADRELFKLAASGLLGLRRL